MRKELLAIAERCEAGTADEQREMLDVAFEAIHGPRPARVHGGSDEMDAYLALRNPFFKMLEANAYESAAMRLLPEGWRVRDFGDWEDRWLLTLMNEDTMQTVESRSGRNLPALAIASAALRASAV